MNQTEKTKRRLQEGLEKKRKYAGYFNWDIDKESAELGVIQELWSSMHANESDFFIDFQVRGSGNDPPDLEATTKEGLKLAIEVTELVDEDCIRHSKSENANPFFYCKNWDESSFTEKLQLLITRKDNKFKTLKSGPYPGGYCVVIFTDEPHLTPKVVDSFVQNRSFYAKHISRSFLILGYQPFQEHLTYFELDLSSEEKQS